MGRSDGYPLERDETLETLMRKKNSEGLNLLQWVFDILFEEGDERFAIEVLKKVDGIVKFMYHLDDRGWLPIFRVLHLFQRQTFENDKIRRQQEIAQQLLDTLFDINYDFMIDSKASYKMVNQLNTFEIMLTVPIDTKFL